MAILRPRGVLLLLLGLLPGLPAWPAGTGEAGTPVRADRDASPDQPLFDVLEYRVRGNTVLPDVVVERTVYGMLGPGKSVADVEKARVALEQAYREAGYPTVFVNLPEQDVGSGVVLLTVTEGRVGTLSITGSRFFSNGWIREQVPEAAAGQVPRLGEFQRQLTLVNARSADRSLTPVLRPGRETGTVDIELKVKDEIPLHGTLEVNNRNSAGTSDTRLNAAVRYDNLWQRDDSFGIQYQVAPEKPSESEVWVGTYIHKPVASDKTFVFYGLKSDSDVATVGSGINVVGKGTVFGTRALIPLPATASLYQSLILGVDYKDFGETVGFDTEGQEDIQTPISYLNWSVAWNGSLPAEAHDQSFRLAVNAGIRDLGNGTQEFADKCFKCKPDYLYLTAGYDLAVPAWQESLVVWSLAGQVSGQPLINNEQFTAGGADSVRGYFEAETLGDYGLRSSLEWRSPNAGPRFSGRLSSLYGYLFGDVASVALHEPLPDQDDTFTLASAGLGLRLNALGLVVGIDWAWPLRDGPSTSAGDDRLLVTARYGF